MSMIGFHNVSFAYDGGDPIFDGVDLTLDTDWRLGLVGRNGRGKTTLLKLLTGELIGTGKIIASVEFEYFPYDFDGRNATPLVLNLVQRHAPPSRGVANLSGAELAMCGPVGTYARI